MIQALTNASSRRMGSNVNTVKTVDNVLDALLSGSRYMCTISGLGCRLSFSFLAAGSPENFKSIDPISQTNEFSAAKSPTIKLYKKRQQNR